GVDSAVGRAHREREDARIGKAAVLPAPAAVPRPAQPGLAQADEDDVGVGRIGREALRAAVLQRKLDAPAAVRLFQPRELAARRRVQPRHDVHSDDGVTAQCLQDGATAPGALVRAHGYTRSVAERTMNEVHNTECAVAATGEVIAPKWTALIVHD